MVSLEEMTGELKTVSEKISESLRKRRKIKEDFKILEDYKKDLEFKINCTLANEVVDELRMLLSEIPSKRFTKIQHLMLDMQGNESGYLKKLENPNNPYGIKFADTLEADFFQRLFGKSLNPKDGFNKFMVYLFSQKEWKNFVKE